MWQRTFARIASVNFRVRRVRSSEEIAAVFIPKEVELGWRPGGLDHESFFAADKSGFFVGELDGKPISCISVVKHCKHYAFFGQYIVDKPYRGKGYGLATWKFSLSSLPDGCNCALDAAEEMIPMYGRYGFKPDLAIQRTILKASLEQLNRFSPSSVEIQPSARVPFGELLDYDTRVRFYQRSSFLQKWISAPNCLSYAAVGKEGEVVGYAVARSTFRKEDGWRVGPIYADDSEIARNLYRAIIENVAGKDPGATITIDVPYGDRCDPESLAIAEELSGEPEVKLVRMFTKGVPPNMCFNKMFGITSLELD